MPRNPGERAADAFTARIDPTLEKLARLIRAKIARGVAPEKAVNDAVNEIGFKRLLTDSMLKDVQRLLTKLDAETDAGPVFRKSWLNQTWPGEELTLSRRINEVSKMEDIKESIRSSMKQGKAWRDLAMDLSEKDLTKADLAAHSDRLVNAARRLSKDPKTISEYRAAVKASMRQVDRLAQAGAPTSKLKAAYQQVINVSGKASGEALDDAIERVAREKMRYNADRIARTEMAKAYSQGEYAEALADEDVIGLGYDLSDRHPKADICCHPSTTVDGIFINKIQVGDMVKTGTGKSCQVGKLYQSNSNKLFKVSFSVHGQEGVPRSVVLTHNHPVLTVRGWIRVCDLKVGDLCICQPLATGGTYRPPAYGDTDTVKQYSQENGSHYNSEKSGEQLHDGPVSASFGRHGKGHPQTSYSAISNQNYSQHTCRPSNSDFSRLASFLKAYAGMPLNAEITPDVVYHSLDCLRHALGRMIDNSVSGSWLWGGNLFYRLGMYAVLLRGVFDNNRYYRKLCRCLIGVRFFDLFSRIQGKLFHSAKLESFKTSTMLKICDCAFSYIKYNLCAIKNATGKIISVDPFEYSGPVYNLGVDENHTYFASGLLTHNCDFHTSADLFGLGAGRYPLDHLPPYPFHPNCLPAGNRVWFEGKLVGACKSFYRGVIKEIRLASGKKFTVTVNHPVLTSGGWVVAEKLCKGMNVVSCLDGERPFLNVVGGNAALKPDNYNRPPLIEDVFKSVKEAPSVRSSKMPATPEDFHGDGRFIDGDIDIVNTDGLLLRDVEAGINKHFREAAFSWGRMVKLALSALRSLQIAFDAPMGAPYRIVSGLCNALATFGRIVKFIPKDNGLTNRPPLDPGFYETALDTVSRNPESVRQALFGLSGKIALDKIVDIKTLPFSGHVYDLQVEPSEIYMCNGVIVKNCLCTVYQVFSGEATKLDPKAAEKYLRGLSAEKRRAMLGVEGERDFRRDPSSWKGNLTGYQGYKSIDKLVSPSVETD